MDRGCEALGGCVQDQFGHLTAGALPLHHIPSLHKHSGAELLHAGAIFPQAQGEHERSDGNILAKLILDVEEDASESAKVALCEAAQQVWFGNYGRPRKTHTSRVDKGVERVHRRQADSVTGMVRERRIAAAAVVAASVVMPPTYYRPGFAQK